MLDLSTLDYGLALLSLHPHVPPPNESELVNISKHPVYTALASSIKQRTLLYNCVRALKHTERGPDQCLLPSGASLICSLT